MHGQVLMPHSSHPWYCRPGITSLKNRSNSFFDGSYESQEGGRADTNAGKYYLDESKKILKINGCYWHQTQCSRFPRFFFNRRTSFYPCSLGWVCCKTVLKRTATVEITRLKLSQRIIDFTFGFGTFLGFGCLLQ